MSNLTDLLIELGIKNPPEISDENDKCVNCGGYTGVKNKTPVDARDFYVDGAGQFCGKCYKEIYKQNG